VVNAAGAWCDVVAEMAGVEPIGLVPLRRTAFMVPGRPEWSNWPVVVDIDQRWYFKPDGEQVLCSPAEEEPSPPCDARPREVDIALAIDRINQATHLGIRSVRSSWTGLRSFVSDRSMVIGFDRVADVVRESLTRLQGDIVRVDPSLGKMVPRAWKRVFYQMERVEKRFHENYRTRDGVAGRHLDHLQTRLHPQGKLQERVVNFNQFLMEEGPGFIDGLLETIDPFCMDHQVIHV